MPHAHPHTCRPLHRNTRPSLSLSHTHTHTLLPASLTGSCCSSLRLLCSSEALQIAGRDVRSLSHSLPPRPPPSPCPYLSRTRPLSPPHFTRHSITHLWREIAPHKEHKRHFNLPYLSFSLIERDGDMVRHGKSVSLGKDRVDFEKKR